MGTNSSKPNVEEVVNSPRKENENAEYSDPRSPTPEIVRTPLHGKGGSKHNITKNVDLRKTFENANGDDKLIHKNPILSAVIKNHLHSYDPRSPTVDFERTPIVISANNDDLGNDKKTLRILNDNNCASPCLKDDNENNFDSCDEAVKSPELIFPKNLCEGFFNISMNDTIKDNDEPLGSSTASNDAIETEISPNLEKPTKLLETNFEFVDDNKELIQLDNVEDINVYNPEVEVNTCKEPIKSIPPFKILNVDPRSPSVGIERTPIVVAKSCASSQEDNVEEMSDDTLIKVLQNTNAELLQNVTKPYEKTSDGLLIYEDESTSLNDTPKKSKSVVNNGDRTPLSCMKNKGEHTRSKSANTLFDPKNQTGNQKLSKRTSHIPRLKALTKQTGSTLSLKSINRTSAISGDCENTPPHSHRDKWDQDNSIVL